MASVFLSYAREDARKAEAFAKCLEAAGHSVWWDHHIAGGSDYSKEIETSLRESDVVVVLWSDASIHSQWVRDEAATGKDSGRLVPVLLGDVEPPLGFRQLQSIPLGNWSGRWAPRNFRTVLEAIAKRAGATGSEPEAPPKSPAPERVRRLIQIGLVAAIAAAALLLLLLQNSSLRPGGDRQVLLAVLPFTDLSPQRNQAFFAEGVAEEILSTVAADTDVRVLGRTSSRQVERDPDPETIRKSLGITHIVEGSMRTDGERLRVNVRLIDTKDGAQIWQDAYEGPLSNVFAVQDRIAAMVLQRVRGTLDRPIAQSRTQRTNTRAYRDYLAARALTRTRSHATLTQAFELVRKAVAAAPDYAPAHALLAQLYFQLSNDPTSYGTMPVETARRLGTPHALRAIQLAPNAPDGYASLGLISSPAKALQPLSRAVHLDPSRAEPRLWLGVNLWRLGRNDESLESMRRAAAVEPLWEVPLHAFVQGLAASGRYGEAVAAIRQYESRGGSKAQVYRMMAAVARWQGNIAREIAFSRLALELDPNIPYLRAHLATCYHLLGFRTESLDILPGELAFARAARSGTLIRSFRLSDAAKVWTAPDGHMVIHSFGARRDWQSLLAIYAAAPTDRAILCDTPQLQAPILALALSKAGRAEESAQLLGCVEARLDQESRSRARAADPQHPEVSDLEFRRATLLALKADKAGALSNLSKAVERGWVGRPYSTRLQDYPQFDFLRGDPRLNELQRQVDAKVTRERREVLRLAAARP